MKKSPPRIETIFNQSRTIGLSARAQRPLNRRGSYLIFAACNVLAALFASVTAQAALLDDFNDNIKTAWSDTLNSGSVTEGGAVFTISSTASAGALTSSKKTSATLTNANGHTIEVRVDVNSITADGNEHAVLGWVPSGALNSSGYSLSVSTTNVTVYKAGVSIYSSNLVSTIQNTNLVLVMRMSASAGAISVKATVYKSGNGNNLILFEHTVTDVSGILGSGNAALGAQNSPSGSAATAVFDNLKAFDIINADFSFPFTASHAVVANLGGGNRLTADNWVDFHSSESLVSVTPVENTSTPGELSITTFNTAATYLVGSFYNGKTFKISDGSRLEFEVDLTGGSDNPVIIPLISYLPTSSFLSTLSTYFIGDATATVVAGKSATTFWVYNVGTSTVKSTRVRLIQRMSGEGTTVRIEQRIEDLDVPDVNDPARVLFETATVDTSSTYLNFNGNFCVLVYHDNTAGGGNTCRFDNALVNQTAPGNVPPIVGVIDPPDGANFSTKTQVVFTVTDDVNIPLNNTVLTLNGVSYSNGVANVNVTPTSSTSTTRTFTLSNLVANTYYNGSIKATDNQGATTTAHYEFDTFSPTNLTVEVEDYNFSTNGTTGGVFIDNPTLVAEPGTSPTSYNGVTGLQDIDFHDNRTTPGTYGDADHSYRSDNPRQYHTGDTPRKKYTDAGGEAAGFFETQLASDVENGDWNNYTRTFPSGYYNVFIREGNYNMAYMLSSLSLVTSGPPTNSTQTTRLLGAFFQFGGAFGGDSGYDRHRTVPLTDVTGNKVIVRFDGDPATVRLTDIFTDFHSDTFQNYLVFVPVPNPGILRPIVALSSPAAGSFTRLSSMPEETAAYIVRRDRTVDLSSVELLMNGVHITSATVTSDGDGGAKVTWSLTNTPPTRVITNTISFQDSDLTPLAYTWTYSYPFLSATNKHSLPGTNVVARGFAHRTVQDDSADGDSLNRAEQQLAIPPEAPVTINFATNIQTLDWNDDNGVPKYVPGLEGGGYNYIATEDLGFLELTAGAHRFTVSSDDGFQLRSGHTPSDLGATILAQSDGDTFGGTFDFVVEADGLYPVRNLWYEQAGAAHFTLSSYNFATSANVVVNDEGNPAGVVKAYLPVALYSSSSASGPYTADSTAVFDIGAKTVTVPQSGSARFYRIYSGAMTTITSITLSGGSVVIKYL
jgi:hypothetical protein